MRRVMRQFVRRVYDDRSRYWAVSGWWGRTTYKRNIVTGNPVVDGVLVCGRPYRSRDDATLARSTIGACPKEGPAKDDSADK